MACLRAASQGTLGAGGAECVTLSAGGAESMMLSAHIESIILSAPPAESMMLSAHAESIILSPPPAESMMLSARYARALPLRARSWAGSGESIILVPAAFYAFVVVPAAANARCRGRRCQRPE
jgi:hypothetical protein